MTPDDYELIPRLPKAEQLPLATFHLSNGNEVRFVGVPELDEMMVGEIADAGAEDFVVGPMMRPAELFRRLAPADSAVPRMVSKLDRANNLAGRTLVDTVDAPIDVSLDQLGIQPPAPLAAGQGSCQPGPAGAQFFHDHHCNSAGGPGYGTSESYCYDGSLEWLQKTSNERRRATYVRMASCGDGMNRMRHLYGTTSGWHTQVNLYVDPHKVVSWWSATEGVRRYRRVRFEAHEPGGWVRGWVKYHRQVAGGWF